MAFQLPYSAESDTLGQMLNFFLGSSKMHLLASFLNVTTATVLSNCTAIECTFSGYVPYTLSTWTIPTIDPSGAAAVTSTGFFTPTGGGGTGQIYGYFLTDSSTAYFYGVEVFATPISAPQNVQLSIAFTYTNLARYGP